MLGWPCPSAGRREIDTHINNSKADMSAGEKKMNSVWVRAGDREWIWG